MRRRKFACLAAAVPVRRHRAAPRSRLARLVRPAACGTAGSWSAPARVAPAHSPAPSRAPPPAPVLLRGELDRREAEPFAIDHPCNLLHSRPPGGRRMPRERALKAALRAAFAAWRRSATGRAVPAPRPRRDGPPATSPRSGGPAGRRPHVLGEVSGSSSAAGIASASMSTLTHSSSSWVSGGAGRPREESQWIACGRSSGSSRHARTAGSASAPEPVDDGDGDAAGDPAGAPEPRRQQLGRGLRRGAARQPAADVRSASSVGDAVVISPSISPPASACGQVGRASARRARGRCSSRIAQTAARGERGRVPSGPSRPQSGQPGRRARSMRRRPPAGPQVVDHGVRWAPAPACGRACRTCVERVVQRGPGDLPPVPRGGRRPWRPQRERFVGRAAAGPLPRRAGAASGGRCGRRVPRREAARSGRARPYPLASRTRSVFAVGVRTPGQPGRDPEASLQQRDSRTGAASRRRRAAAPAGGAPGRRPARGPPRSRARQGIGHSPAPPARSS